MLQEIFVATYHDRRSTSAILSLGTAKQPDWSMLTSLDELTDMVTATKQALPNKKKGEIAIATPVWQEFENVYYQRVVKPAFADHPA